jgi:ribonuclease P protein component
MHLSDTGVRVYNRHYIAIYKAGLQKDRPRLGITVTKKVGGAVTRNRIKRIVREYFRTNRDSIQGTLDINIIAKKAVAGLTHAEAYGSLRNIFSRLSTRM